MQKIVKFLPYIFVLIFFMLGFSSSLQESPTKDEVCHHIPSGYVFLTKGDLKFDTAHPPLARCIEALPLLALKLNLPNDSSYWRKDDRASFAKDFLYKENNCSQLIVSLSRVMVLLIACLGGLFLYFWAKRQFSRKIALFSLFFYCLCPNIMAHSRLSTTDSMFMVFFMVSVFTFLDFLQRQNLKSAVISGVSLGIALLTKYTAIFLIPLYLIIYIFEKRCKKIYIKSFVLLCITAFLVLWAGYNFEFRSILKDAMRPVEKISLINEHVNKAVPVLDQGIKNNIASFILNTPFPASTYALGVLGVIRHGAEGHGFYFMGKTRNKGTPLFYVVAFLIKTPIPIILLFLFGMYLSFSKRLSNEVDIYLMIVFASYFLIASFFKLQLGLRYILQLYPICFIFAAKAAYFMTQKARLKLIVSILCLWLIGSNIFIYPHYLSYFNEFIGGPKNGYKYLRDSNLDWGQDLIGIQRYLKREGIKSIKLSYDGSADPHYYGIESEVISEKEMATPESKVYVISSNNIDGFSWARAYKPTAIIGHATFIYDLRGSNANR